MGKRWFITRTYLYKCVNNKWFKFQSHVPACQLVLVYMRRDQARYESNIKIPTHWSRWCDVYTALLHNLVSCLITCKGLQKQICWYYDFFQIPSFFLWVLCHQNKASHKWLVYERILDQVLWHLPIKRVLLINEEKNESIAYCLETTQETCHYNCAPDLLYTYWGRL